jgi:hypothetical protein
MLRRQRDRARVARERFVGPSKRLERIAAIAMDHGGARIERDRRIEARDRLDVTPEARQRAAEVVVRARVSGLAAGHGLEQRQGFGECAAPAEAHGHKLGRLDVVGIVLEHLPGDALGLGNVARLKRGPRVRDGLGVIHRALFRHSRMVPRPEAGSRGPRPRQSVVKNARTAASIALQMFRSVLPGDLR